jgi:DNA-directed RNA polymerase specialized sigma54-like protein
VATTSVRARMDDLRSSEQSRQNRSFQALLKATDTSVPWVYDVWDDLLRTLVEGDNRQRSIAAQLLSNLAKSDSRLRMLKDIRALMRLTKDERFVTARHCLQSLWKVGVAGESQRTVLVRELKRRFKECQGEKNCRLIRYDILVVMRRVYEVVKDESIRSTARGLIALEEDPKYAAKYSTVWGR